MKRIPLTQGKFAIVDDEDYEYLMQWKWHLHKGPRTNYAARNQSHPDNGPRGLILMHRMILKAPRGVQVDHANHNGQDNRKHNIRICSVNENQYNQLPQKNNESKYKGVSRYRKRWRVRICYRGKRFYLGSYLSDTEAAKAYDVAARKIFGEFACLNCGIFT